MQNRQLPLLVTILCLFVLLIFFWYLFSVTDHSDYQGDNHPKLEHLKIDPTKNYYYELELPNQTLHFNLVDPEQAPEAIREQVGLGWKLMHQTQQYAKGYVGNALTCSNCHFSCGNTFGGKNGSISLVGSTTWYPSYSERSKTTITLKDRIDNCFKRSLNGKPLPEGSKEMEAIIAYLGWISKDVAILKETPWRGLIHLKTEHKPDPLNGKKVYIQTCAPCHQPNGEGLLKEDDTLQIPPLWGPMSYNNGAGMNRLELLSAFIYWNMPFQQPCLTEEEALDVAAFLIEQKRPVFDENKYPAKKKKNDSRP